MADELEVVTAERDMLLLQVDQLTHDNRLLRNSNARHLIDLAAMREAAQDHDDLHHKVIRTEVWRKIIPLWGDATTGKVGTRSLDLTMEVYGNEAVVVSAEAMHGMLTSDGFRWQS